jgi:hypothetical protein
MHWRMVVSYRSFGKMYRFHLRMSGPGIFSWTAWPSKLGVIDCPETSVWNYHSMLHKIPKQRRSHVPCYIPEEGYVQVSIFLSISSLPNVLIGFLIFRLLHDWEKRLITASYLTLLLSLSLSVCPSAWNNSVPLDEFLSTLIIFYIIDILANCNCVGSRWQ